MHFDHVPFSSNAPPIASPSRCPVMTLPAQTHHERRRGRKIFFACWLGLAHAASSAHRPSRPSHRSGHWPGSASHVPPRRLEEPAASDTPWPRQGSRGTRPGDLPSAAPRPIASAATSAGAPGIARAHEIVGLECQYSGLELEPCPAAAGCVQRLLEEAVGLREVSCRRGCQPLAVTRDHGPVRVCRLGSEASDLIGVSRRSERVVAKPGKLDGDICGMP